MSIHALSPHQSLTCNPQMRKHASTIMNALAVAAWLAIGYGVCVSHTRWTAQQKLNKLLITAFEESGTGILVVDSNRNVVLANAAAGHLFSQNPVGRDLLEIASAPKRAELQAAYKEALTESAVESVKLDCVNRTLSREHPRCLNVMLRPAKTASGDVMLVTITPEKIAPGFDYPIPNTN